VILFLKSHNAPLHPAERFFIFLGGESNCGGTVMQPRWRVLRIENHASLILLAGFEVDGF
jgi:hypothetical protein